jgi:Rrf2 family cysteine metabolism transcriptional repressor
MRFSKKSEYALRALIELTMAYGGTPVRRHQIAGRQNIPIVFLEQILLALKHAGLLASARGAQGGYALIKPPTKVTLGQVIRILDGPLAPIGCVSKTAYKKCRDCPYAKKAYCPLQAAMGEVRNAIADILDNYSLEDFISVARSSHHRRK